ncbi:MAG: HAD-IA family hydrolase [Saprospiraceae bacterium]
MNDSRLKFILFDMIGTTVQDAKNDDSLIIECFKDAFSINGFQASFLEINQQRGKSKKDAIKNILKSQHQSNELSDQIYTDFIRLMKDSLTSFAEIEGASGVFRVLQEHGIKIGLGSGLTMDMIVGIMEMIGWKLDSFDYIGSSESLGKGRPDPIMIHDAMYRLNIEDLSRVLKIGDTVADIQEGKNAGVLTACVLTGTQKRDELEKYKPDYIFADITEIIQIL